MGGRVGTTEASQRGAEACGSATLPQQRTARPCGDKRGQATAERGEQNAGQSCCPEAGCWLTLLLTEGCAPAGSRGQNPAHLSRSYACCVPILQKMAFTPSAQPRGGWQPGEKRNAVLYHCTPAPPTHPHAHAPRSAEAQQRPRSLAPALRGLAGRGLTEAVAATGLEDPPGSLLSVFWETGAVQQVWVGAERHHLGTQRCGLGSWHPSPQRAREARGMKVTTLRPGGAGGG